MKKSLFLLTILFSIVTIAQEKTKKQLAEESLKRMQHRMEAFYKERNKQDSIFNANLKTREQDSTHHSDLRIFQDVFKLEKDSTRQGRKDQTDKDTFNNNFKL
ncbi:hypothetical protein HX017_10725 [Myroides marinus]|uniref:hypothetical protein n=1 Tax=Myroides marinus TaxID=703342 RepID=UPI0025751A81|nr:hypothetical protein [Myroides marinus]MDM1347549.1 hypothetical protein [Myroides marinus]MDM1350799.1 hypothetical protein [Myroides marinus]MDM1355278.1 hypothetical protein [Myroides marinus]MDM1358006.1 hypothetical protein [Myroides marinus]MDM1363248.1 hypothetical protein [Myroides marinus]